MQVITPWTFGNARAAALGDLKCLPTFTQRKDENVFFFFSQRARLHGVQRGLVPTFARVST